MKTVSTQTRDYLMFLTCLSYFQIFFFFFLVIIFVAFYPNSWKLGGVQSEFQPSIGTLSSNHWGLHALMLQQRSATYILGRLRLDWFHM